MRKLTFVKKGFFTLIFGQFALLLSVTFTLLYPETGIRQHVSWQDSKHRLGQKKRPKILRKRNNTSSDVNSCNNFHNNNRNSIFFENGTSSKLDALEFLPIVGFRLRPV